MHISVLDYVPQTQGKVVEDLGTVVASISPNRNFLRDFWDEKVKSVVGGNAKGNAEYAEDWIAGDFGKGRDCLLARLAEKAASKYPQANGVIAVRFVGFESPKTSQMHYTAVGQAVRIEEA